VNLDGLGHVFPSTRRKEKGLKFSVRCLAVALVTLPAALINPVPAGAAPMGKGRVMLCSQGTFASSMVLLGTDVVTEKVPAGSCVTRNIDAGTWGIEVRLHWVTSPNSWPLCGISATPDSNPGIKIYTVGSSGNSGETAGCMVRTD
jgi:hypothetical protein